MRTLARRSWTETKPNGEVVVHKNDIYLASGHLAVASGLDACAQAIEAVVETVRGEMQLDLGKGVPYFSTVFESRQKMDEWAAAVRAAVSELAFVESIEDFTYSAQNGVLTYRLSVVTTEGETTISGREG